MAAPRRPVWNYWVNNYLQGRPPPAFDILYWNADTTRLPAALHRGFIAGGPGQRADGAGRGDHARLPGRPVQDRRGRLRDRRATDHLCPWQSCYRTTQLLGGQVKFVLSTSGHIAAMVNPPSNAKAAFQTAPPDIRTPANAAPSNPADPREFLASAQTVPGSWWPDYSAWLAVRSGGSRRARPSSAGRPTRS